jgi:hypothetical protein
MCNRHRPEDRSNLLHRPDQGVRAVGALAPQHTESCVASDEDPDRDVEWPSMAAARAWYDSPSYNAIRHLRQDNAKYTGVLVEAGTAPTFERLRNRIR